jgi:hypothetical protein
MSAGWAIEGAVVSRTITLNAALLVPAEFDALQCTAVVPSAKVDPLDGLQLTGTEPLESLAVTAGYETAAPFGPVASAY